MPVDSNKYIVFKREDFDRWHDRHGHRLQDDHPPAELPDAVVIRQQDVFSPPALDAYANSIEVALSLAHQHGEITSRLKDIADYFHTKAAEAWHMHRKLPD